MGVLSVRHLTTYHYAEPVRPGEHRMMFRPRESHDLRLIRARLNITPQPADLHWLHDVFDKSVAVANFDCATTLITSPVALLSAATVRAPLSATVPLPIGDGGATHAWPQVYLPGAGWVDFDPTNSIIGNRNLIRVAVACSPMQVLPLWGTYIGSASSCLGMQVMVSVTEEPDHSNTLA